MGIKQKNVQNAKNPFLALACAASQAALLSRGGGGRDNDRAAPFDGLNLGETTIADAFAEADLNADGNLDCAEALALWVDYEENAVLEAPRRARQIRRVIKRFDLDDVKGLNLEEFTALVDFEYVTEEEDDEDALDDAEDGDEEAQIEEDEGEILVDEQNALEDAGDEVDPVNGGGAYGG